MFATQAQSSSAKTKGCDLETNFLSEPTTLSSWSFSHFFACITTLESASSQSSKDAFALGKQQPEILRRHIITTGTLLFLLACSSGHGASYKSSRAQ